MTNGHDEEAKKDGEGDEAKRTLDAFLASVESKFLTISPLLLPSALIAFVVSAFFVTNWSEFMEQWGHFSLLGVLLLAIWLEVWRKRIEDREEFERKDKLAQRETDLSEERLAMEVRAQEARSQAIIREARSLGRVGEKLASEVADNLTRDPSWAVQALQRASIGHISSSLFALRSDHFRDEKKLLAERFLPLLINRFGYHRDKDKIFLLIDAGTGLYPLFELLAGAAIQAEAAAEEWVEKLERVKFL